MKKGFKVVVLLFVFAFMLLGCSGGMKSKLMGAWYRDGSTEVAFILYDDGTCEIAGEYGTGTWSLVNNNELKLTNYYGETESSPIVSVENGCLKLGDASNAVVFYNEPSESND